MPRKKQGLIESRDDSAAETFARIRRDIARLHESGQRCWQVTAFLEALLHADLLFREGLRVGDVLTQCRVKSGDFSARFRLLVGCKPSEYLPNQRLAVAARMLAKGIKIGWVAEAVGVIPASWFTQLFKKWAGMTPREYQKRMRQGDRPPLPVDDPVFLERAWNGDLDEEETEHFLFYTRITYPGEPEPRIVPCLAWGEQLPEPLPEPDHDFLDEVTAEVICRRLARQTPEEQDYAVRHQAGFKTTRLFELLLAKSEEEGARSPERRLEIAELAAASLDSLDKSQGENLANLQTRAWAVVGNARVLVYDFPGAEKAFKKAEVAWSVPRQNRDELALAELRVLKGMLRFLERRYDEALTLNGQALEILRKSSTSKLLIQTLIARATIQDMAGKRGAAVKLLEESMARLEALAEPGLRLTAASSLANFHARAGSWAEAHRWLALARQLAQEEDRHSARWYLLWTDGVVCNGEGKPQEAEQCFLAAQAAFQRLGKLDDEADLSLEIAELYLAEGRPTEALEQIARALPVFEALRIRPEALRALQLIREALAQDCITMCMLAKIRGCMDKLTRDPILKYHLQTAGGQRVPTPGDSGG